jgi:deoxyribonuclease-2
VQRLCNGALGHTKGVLAFDTASDTALWLLHSWPKYVDPDQSAMPTPMYGQTFICLSLTLADIEAIATQMVNNQQPEVFGAVLPEDLPEDSPIHTLDGTINSNAPANTDTISLATRGGLNFKVIAKDRKWNRDFWNDLVGPELEANMNVETWIRGQIPPQADSDGVHKTIDIKYIDFRDLGIPWTWPETHDHAKWGITTDNDWVCVGDINRMISPRQRGGGTIAFQHPGLWGQLNQTDFILPTARQICGLSQAPDPAKRRRGFRTVPLGWRPQPATA